MFLILNPIAGVTAQICKYLKLEGGKNCIFMIELRIHGNVQHCKIINILFGYFLGFVVACFDYFYSPLVFVTIVVGKLSSISWQCDNFCIDTFLVLCGYE